jgi:predicted nicotinamide N-methyase
VELGAGTGLPGIAATVCLGAAHCVLANVVALLSGLKANTVANRVSAVGPHAHFEGGGCKFWRMDRGEGRVGWG